MQRVKFLRTVVVDGVLCQAGAVVETDRLHPDYLATCRRLGQCVDLPDEDGDEGGQAVDSALPEDAGSEPLETAIRKTPRKTPRK